MATSTPARSRAQNKKTRSAKVSSGFILLIGRLLSLISLAWNVLAKVFGALIRAVGHGASEIDPKQRRDGLGLVLLALSIIVAAQSWFGTQTVITNYSKLIIGGFLGALTIFLPVVLVYGAWQTFRNPAKKGDGPRIAIGVSSVLISVSGLWHLYKGLPNPGDGVAAMQSGAGWLGWVVATPLTGLTNGLIASLMLLLFGFFGLLITTKTPVSTVGVKIKTLLLHIFRKREKEVSDDLDQELDAFTATDYDEELIEDDIVESENEEEPLKKGNVLTRWLSKWQSKDVEEDLETLVDDEPFAASPVIQENQIIEDIDSTQPISVIT